MGKPQCSPEPLGIRAILGPRLRRTVFGLERGPRLAQAVSSAPLQRNIRDVTKAASRAACRGPIAMLSIAEEGPRSP